MSLLAVEPRLRLDIGVRDLAAGALACALATDPRREEQVLLDAWGLPDGIACLSIRSAFDLLLDALDLPPGSEVAFSAVTHPDMPRIARAHGLRVVPLDLDPATLAPTEEAADAGIGPGTRLVVVAHLFGTRVDLEPLSRRCGAVGALLVEDCAQTIRGPSDHGSELADVSLFSFGAIKTATALGGALVRVGNPALRDATRRAQERLQQQSRSHQLGKVVKFTGLVLVGRPFPYGLLLQALTALGRDPDAFLNGLVRAFPPASVAVDANYTEELMRRIRRRPSAPLLALVRYRLSRFDRSRLRARAATGEAVVRGLPPSFDHPGRNAPLRTHWVVPVVAPEPEVVVRRLRDAGFDAARATSSIEAVAAPDDRPDLVPHAANALMAGIVFVPAPPELGARRLRRLVAALAAAGRAEEQRHRERVEVHA